MRLAILGTRGIPARHGGFETFAERLALHLVSRGWEVCVYCQGREPGAADETWWNGVQLIHVPVRPKGALGTIVFDLKSMIHAIRKQTVVLTVVLTLGYNTALFSIGYRWAGLPNLMNMDGIEWRRRKWNFIERAWLYGNERLGSLLADHLIADNPEIRLHLERHTTAGKITMIPYGADRIISAEADPVRSRGLEPDRYALVVARLEPENSIDEIITAFSRRHRGCCLAVIGSFDPEYNAYHRKVKEAASSEVVFLGSIYDRIALDALRYHARLYIHGHTVGGTNPSLVEALGAGMAVLARENRFNRWVAGESARYFVDEVDCEKLITSILEDDAVVRNMKQGSITRHRESFNWEQILYQYEELLSRWALTSK